MPEPVPPAPSIRADGQRSIAAHAIAAATTGDNSPIIKLEPGTLRSPDTVDLSGQVSNLPQAPSAVFVGRIQALVAMRNALADVAGQVVIGQVILGMGGVGKSELVRHYTADQAERYRLVWWITATDSAQIIAGLVALAERLHPPLPLAVALSTVLGVEQTAQWARSWLQAHDRWLLGPVLRIMRASPGWR
ncbi:hypothetical protein [Streptosporangium sp. NBC_01756]|uniref:hypothetical protein n=1 Tax=Streptosporangium sp. NBC_01756 TaxID=2975950 RepID=UPI002DD8B373|nr:hypothetical protein [Streptosporangium sp. NBC_01756]WSC89466.1 hypothetical protein OIE48_15170 [Streptosporangium sp. NBC_01756]